MANIQSAKKRIRQNERRAQRNRHRIAAARTYVRRVRTLIDEGKLDEADVAAKDAYSILDKAARKGVIHRHNASRRKGRLMAALAAARKAEASS